MIIERKNGGWSVYATVGGQLEQRFYLDYTKREAVEMFRHETRVTFLNWKGPAGRETVDEVRRSDFKDGKTYVMEIARLVREYTMAGMDVYRSSRACADWT